LPRSLELRSLRWRGEALTPRLIVGSLTAIVSTVATAKVLGASDQAVFLLASKSATRPTAMAVATEIGGLPSLHVVLVISTGVLGAVITLPMASARRISDDYELGPSLGLGQDRRHTNLVCRFRAVLGYHAMVKSTSCCDSM
jgi:putative effector of murein hydrolase